VPSDARKRLRAVAKRLGRTETDIASELFLEGLRRVERNHAYASIAEEMTPEARKRMIEIAEAFGA
jgi:hypothetical protein